MAREAGRKRVERERVRTIGAKVVPDRVADEKNDLESQRL